MERALSSARELGESIQLCYSERDFRELKPVILPNLVNAFLFRISLYSDFKSLNFFMPSNDFRCVDSRFRNFSVCKVPSSSTIFSVSFISLKHSTKVSTTGNAGRTLNTVFQFELVWIKTNDLSFEKRLIGEWRILSGEKRIFMESTFPERRS